VGEGYYCTGKFLQSGEKKTTESSSPKENESTDWITSVKI